MKKNLLIILAAVVLLSVGAISFYILNKKEPVTPVNKVEVSEKKGNTIITINTEENFKQAVSLVKLEKYDEADAIFSSLEKTATMDNLGYLKLKKLQIAIVKNDYKMAVMILEGIISNPQFSNQLKSRALENVFTSFLGSGRNKDYYQTIFSSPSFQSLKATSSTESLYNYSEYAFSVYPTTVFGANVFYKRLEIFKKIDKGTPLYKETINNLNVFNEELLAFSNKELKNLESQPNQEIALIIIHTERARVINVISHQKDLTVPEGFSRENELVSAVRIAQELKLPFYLFYTNYNYINFLASGGFSEERIPKTIKETVHNPQFFDKATATKEWYTSTIGDSKTWTPAELAIIKKINTGLYALINK